jgi:hypothetical protein
MNSLGLHLLTESATKSKYLRLCMQGSVSLSSYTSFVECRCKHFPLKYRIITSSVPENGRLLQENMTVKNYLKIGVLL